MHAWPPIRPMKCCVVVSGAALIVLSSVALAADVQTNPFQDGKAGFVVSDIGYALSRDAKETGACPNGMTSGLYQLIVH
jgi:hypothetical protein